MPPKLFFSLFIAITLAASTRWVGSNRWTDEGKSWWKHVEYLAGDNMQGRSVGSHGFDMAASYVAEQFERSGLKAAGNDGYFQKVWFTETSLHAGDLTLERNGKVTEILVPGDARVNFNMYSAPVVVAPVVFAGYGLKIPEIGQDDFEGLPLKGAVVAYLAGAPEDIPGNLRAHYNSMEQRWKTMRAAGAVGMIVIPNPQSMELSWAKQSVAWDASRISLADPKLNEFEGMRFNATWNPAAVNELLAGSKHSFADIVLAAEHNAALPHFVMACRIRARTVVVSSLLKSKNVVAAHPGTDANLKDEYVIISAHLDHLGVGKPAHGHAIFNGAMDDASGVASVIEIAKMLKNVRTKRSLLFLALTGEEKGELGSEYFVRYPTVRGRLVADLNMDMFLPLFSLKWLEVQGLDESSLGGDIKAIAEGEGVKVQSDKEPDKNRLLRSDQYSFVKDGVPALAFKFGYLKGDPEEKIFQHWFAERYHSVTDDLNQPVDLAAAAQFNDILKSVLVRIADAEQAPRWRQDSFFKRFDKHVETVPGI